MKKYNSSKILCVFISILIFVLHYCIRKYNYKDFENVLGWDVLAYYLYLPFTFIYHDPGMVNQAVVQHIFELYNPSNTFYQAFQIPNGNWVTTYTIGLAVLFAPFFFIAHLWATLSGTYPADGFSFPYQYCISNGVMVYSIWGIFVIRKVLLQFFNERITMLVLILLLLGTNFLHETTSDETMPHAILFTGYALILWLTIQWHEQPKAKTAFWLGVVLGVTILSRGNNIVAIFIPLLWNVYDRQSLSEKLKTIQSYKQHIVIAILGAMILPVLQIINWKIITGNFFFYGYQNSQGFDWGGDHIMKVLFAYKKSWFLYTPMIMLPIIGIYFMRKMCKPAFWSVFIFFITNFYIIASWAGWWQGGSFGMRYFVESYAVMAIPFGFFIKRISEKGIFVKNIIGLIAGFFLFLNLFQTWQFNNWMIDGYAMTKEYYWKIFLKTKATDDDKKLKEIIRDFSAKEFFKDPENYNRKTIGYMNFDSINSVYIESFFLDSLHYVSPPYSCKLTKDHIYSPTLRLPYNAVTKKGHFWIRVSMDYFSEQDMKDVLSSLVILFTHKNGFVNKYMGYDLEKFPYKPNQWNYVSVDYLTPDPYSDDDLLVIYVYLRGDKELYIDNFNIEAFERKW